MDTAWKELKKNVTLIEKVVASNQKEKLARVFRTTAVVRRGLTPAELTRALTEILAEDNEIRSTLLKYVALVKPDAADDVDMNAGEDDPAVGDVEQDANIHMERSELIEVETYLSLLVIALLLKAQLGAEAQACANLVRERCMQFNRRTLDLFAARVMTYFAYAFERYGEGYTAIRPLLLAAHRTACLRCDEIGQATLLNLLLRNYLHENLYDQAYKLVSKTTFPETVSNNQFVRYLYYVGKIHAVQLEYTDSYTKLMQSIRKAPQNTAIGFRRTVYKLAIIVQLLMGEVPERSIFNQPELKTALLPYLQLTNAVRVGNLEDFTAVLTQFADVFKADKTHTLILRLRHNVIKTGLRKINTSYSKILFSDICTKLALDTPQNAEFVCAKAIRDGVIDAVIDHKHGWMQSKETVDVYATTEPQQAFHKRITFCLDVHNEAVKAMRYPPGAYKKDLESAEERLEREKQEDELAKEIEEELDEGL
ncbi:26S proteasome non-ATPase regulatory subunit 3 [Achlya hypogyna]|uniref:26S proteasome non-ATPase regulatory subunit 3 n=1 Tax=Achlya hypogyna TaxID=1202772 RepID=A0A1V9Z222_ACHHY|nr:26S proteasome non-ATPase regulatory subunit 3 [Achlya hypogyna]